MKVQKIAVGCLVSVMLAVCGSSCAFAQVGASTPFTTYEAEAGTLAGGATVVSLTSPPTTEFSSPQLEASGHAYVALTGTGQSITWTNNTSVNFSGINIRFCIPDATSGGGTTATLDLYVNGVFRQAVTLNSSQEWFYETASNYNSYSKVPSSGYPHKFWDDAHVLISGTAVAPGSTVTLQQDSANTAAFYWIDCVDLEPIPAALTQPANSLSIVTYGAVANSPTTDSTTAIQNCINAAQSSGQIVWVPAGTFYMNTTGGISGSNVAIQGAGPWYSTIYRDTPTPQQWGQNLFYLSSSTIQNIRIDSNDNYSGGAAVCLYGSNWLANNVWVQHLGVGVWADGTNGTAENCRVMDTYGDGINLNNQTASFVGNNLTAINNFIRTSGDDSIAINSVAQYPMMNNTTVINNTTVAPWWANGLRLAGGANDLVKNNLITDSVRLNGIDASVFASTGSALQSGIVQGNVLLRCGSYGYGAQQSALVIGTTNETNSVDSLYVGSNTVSNSMFEGIHVYKNAGNIVAENNTVALPGTTGVIIDSDAVGAGTLNANIVSNLNSGQAGFVNNSTSFSLDTENEPVDAPIEASSFSSETGGIGTQTCNEGGLNLEGITSGSYTVYNNINLNGVTAFALREACWNPSGTTLQVYLDSPTGTLIGTCALPATGGAQTWATATCNVSGATGYHNVYLVNTSSHDHNIEWFAFQGPRNVIPGTSYNGVSGAIGIQSCSEGGWNLDNVTTGNYVVYTNLNLNGVTCFNARVASAVTVGQAAGTISVCLDSPTGTLIGTLPVTGTGGWQNWSTQTCNISGASGYHNVYLVFTGTGSLPNLEWFSFPGTTSAIPAARWNGVSGPIATQACSEGGLNIDTVRNGSYVNYNALNLNGVTGLAVRVASATAVGQPAGTISIYYDSPTGTLIGTLPVTGTGGWQTWSTQVCPIVGATGYHNIYLVFSGTGDLPNVEWLDLEGNSNAIEATNYNNVSGAIATEACSEGGLNLYDISNGNYTVYNQINLTGMVSFNARVASTTTGGSIQVRLDSPTGTLIGTLTVPGTGGAQTWSTQICNLTATTGYHNIYLVYTGGSGYLFNLESFQFTYGDFAVDLTSSEPTSPPATDTPLLPAWANCVLAVSLLGFGLRTVRTV